jgi:hypothetical protein
MLINSLRNVDRLQNLSSHALKRPFSEVDTDAVTPA